MEKVTPSFPPRTVFTFDQLKSLWKVEDDDIERAIIAGLLRPCIDLTDTLLTIPEWGPDRIESRMVPSGRRKYTERTRRTEIPVFAPPPGAGETWTAIVEVPASDYEEVQTQKDFPEAPLAPLYLRLPDYKPPHVCKFTVGSIFRDADPPATPFQEPDSCWYYLPSPMTMADVKEKCFFPISEVAQYEAAHSGGGKSEKDLGGRERTALLRTIGGLLEFIGGKLVDSGGPSGRKENSTVRWRRTEIADMLAERFGYDGMSSSNIKKKFTAGLQSVGGKDSDD